MNDRNWGGRRAGAGRKPSGIEFSTFSISLPAEERALLFELAKRKKQTVSRFISTCLGLAVAVEFEKQQRAEASAKA